MKRVSKFYLGLVALMMGLGLMLQSCGGLTAAGLAASANEGCPKEVSEGVVLQSVTSEGSWVVFNYTVPDDTSLEAISNMPDDQKQVMADDIKSSDPEFFEGCSILGVGIKYIYKTSSEQASVELPAEMLK